LIGSIILELGAELGRFAALKEFWFRRWMRTLPNYWLFLIILLIVGAINAEPFPNLWPYLTFSQNLSTPHPGFYPEAWSLALEEWFYLAFPLAIFFTLKLSKSFDRTFIILLILFLLAPLGLRFYQYATNNIDFDGGFRKIVLLRLDAIMFGVLAAWVKRSYPQFWKQHRLWLGLTGLVMFSAGMLLWGKNELIDKTILFSCIDCSIAMLIPFGDGWILQRENAFSAGIRSVAKWSYSLYLCNLTVISLIRPIEDFIMSKTGWIWPAYTSVWIGYFVVCMIISALVYRFYEMPIMSLRDQTKFPLRRFFVETPQQPQAAVDATP
jgi:peptidoglycan/LPS O-acetylase OafA/YrhL